jgi:hypothetical protein
VSGSRKVRDRVAEQGAKISAETSRLREARKGSTAFKRLLADQARWKDAKAKRRSRKERRFYKRLAERRPVANRTLETKEPAASTAGK